MSSKPRSRWWRRIGRALVLIAVIVLGLHLARDLWLPAVTRRALVWAGPRYLGLDLTLAEVETRGYERFELRGLSAVARDEAGALRRLDAVSLTVEIDLVGLLRGSSMPLRLLEGQQLLVELDATRGGEADAEPSEGGPLSLPEHLPSISLSGLTLDAVLPGLRLGLADFELDAQADRVQLAGRVDLRGPPYELEDAALAGSLKYSAERIELEHLELDGRRVAAESWVEFSGQRPGELAWDLALEGYGGRLATRGELREGVLEGQLELEALRLEDALAGSPLTLSEFPRAALSLSARGRLPLEDLSAASAELTLDAVDLEAWGWRFATLEAEASLDRGRLSVPRLLAQQPRGRVELTAAELPLQVDSLEQLLRGASGNLVLELEELGAFLADPRQLLPAELLELALSAELQTGTAEVELVRGALSGPGFALELERGVLRVPEDPSRAPWDGSLELAVTGTIHDPAALPGGHLPAELRGAVELALELSGELAGESPILAAHLQLHSDALVLDELETGALVADLRAAGPVAELHEHLAAELTGSQLRWRGRELEQISLSAHLEPGRLIVERLSARPRTGQLTATELELPTDLADPWNLLARGRGRLELTDVDPRAWLAPAPAGAESRLPTGQLSLVAELGGGELRLLDGSLRSLGGELRLADGALRLTQDPPLDLGDLALELDLDADFADLQALDDLFGVEGWHGALHADVQLRGPLPALEGELSLACQGAQVAGLNLGDLNLEAQADAQHIELSLDLAGADVGELHLGADLARDGYGAPDAISIEHLEYGREGGQLRLAEAENLDLLDGADIESLELAGGTGRLVASLETGAGAGRLGLLLEDFDPTALLTGFGPEGMLLSGLNGELALGWEDGTPTLSGQLAARVLKLHGEAPELSASLQSFEFRDDRLDLTELVLETAGGASLRASGSLPLDPFAAQPLGPGPLELDAALNVPDIAEFAALTAADTPHSSVLTGALESQLQLSGDWQQLTGSLQLNARELVAEAPSELPLGRSSMPLSLAAELHCGEDLELTRLEMSLPGMAELRASGKLETPLAPAAWLAEGGAGPLEAPLELALHLDASDLSWAADWIQGLRRTGGALQAELIVGGSLTEPSVDGHLAIVDGELKLAADVPALSEIRARLALNAEGLAVEELRGELGGAPFEISGGVGMVDGVSLDLHCRGENLLLVRGQGLQVRADAELALSGPLAGPTLGGSIALRNSRFTRQVDLLSTGGGASTPTAQLRGIQLFSFTEPPLSDLAFDVEVTSAEPFRLRNYLVNGSVRPRLHLGGTGLVPLPVGSIFVDATRISAPSGTIRVTSGLIDFKASNPFVPEVEISANARLATYDILMQVSGPFDDPDLVLSSIPPLTEAQLILLVSTGQAPGSSGQDTGIAAAQSVGSYVAMNYFSQVFGGGGGGDGESFTARFEYVAGRNVSRNGNETLEGAFRVADDVLRDQDSLYLTANRDIFENYNAGIRILFRLR